MFMRLKQNLIMILVLGILLVSMSLGGLTLKKEPIVPEDDPQDEPIVDIIPTSFCKQINSGEDIPNEVIDVVKHFMDDYFLSIYTLEKQDTAKYFINEIDGKISDYAIKLTLESRKLYDFDFTMSDAYYILNITNYSFNGDEYHIDFLEDDYFCFKFLSGISSESYDIENSIVIKNVNGEYKIASYEKVQGYYTMFADNRNENMDDIYNYYFERLKNVIEDENYKKDIAKNKPYVNNQSYVYSYDRASASKYVEEYCHKRNEKYYDFSDEGGNCQNLASQALATGGLGKDIGGEYEWYFNSYSDYVPSWVHVSSFNDYCRNNDSGIVCEVDANIYYAEPGDIVQVGISSISHSTVVSKIVDGHILLNSNSIDMKDFPLEAYVYPVRKLIKILGSNS